MFVVERGASRGPSRGDRWEDEVVADKGPAVLMGEPDSEPLSLGRLSLRRRFRTRELFDRLWVGLSAMVRETDEDEVG